MEQKTSVHSQRNEGSPGGVPYSISFADFMEYRGSQEYQSWWTCRLLGGRLRALPESTLWNWAVCVVVLFSIIWLVIKEHKTVLDILFNIMYGVHVAAILYAEVLVLQHEDVDWWRMFGFLIDFVSYLHYAIVVGNYKVFKLICYYLRLHRPFRYLWQLNDYNLKGSILFTSLKYIYISFVMRTTWALIWLHTEQLDMALARYDDASLLPVSNESWHGNETSIRFLAAICIINKMFIPIGPSVPPSSMWERLMCLMVMLTGCLVLTGAAVASLSLVISIYMRPEEAFRERFLLIMKIMKESNIPPSLREKVETFYRMYWHKQRAVSATQLLPTYPPTLPAAIYTDIYFEATQKSRILRDLSYQFLTEIAKKMTTIYYIPGDTIIKRTSKKSSVIFITSGEVEMLSAEDDITAVVRMIRGSVVAGCASLPAAACARAHTAIRAATYCVAHALTAPDLWRVALKYGRDTDQTQILLAAFYEHLERVKKHYFQKLPEEVKFKSSILHFKKNLISLKEATDSEGKLLLDRDDVFLEIAGCYILRNRAEGSHTDDADAICLRSTFPCILQPASSLQNAWSAFVCCTLLIVAFVHPYFLVFSDEVPMEFRFFDYVVTAIFVIDLIVHLSTGTNVEEGVPITFLQTSSQHIRSRWFIIAVFGTLPIFEFVGSGHFAGINKLLRLPKLFRTLKYMEEVCVYHSNVLRFMSYTLLLVIACYLIAALQHGFMCHQFDYCLVTNFTHPPYWAQGRLDSKTVEHSLTYGLYWAISMVTFTTHMESWGVNRSDSLVYTLFLLELCVVFHILIEAVYSATIMVTTALREDHDNCVGYVKDFLIRNEVAPLLRQRFITYLELCWLTDKAYLMTNKKSSIFHDLPPHVHQDILTRQRSKYLLSIPFMKLLNKEELKDVSSKTKLFYTSPNEILLNTGDISNEMYLIRQGYCEIVDPATKKVVGSLGAKKHFGVLECLLRLPSYYTIRAVTHVQIFSISKKVLTKAMKLPKIKDAIDFAKEQPEYDRLCVHRESFQQYEPPAPAPNTERLRLPRKHEQDSAFLQPFQQLGFFAILRYIFPRFSLRPDGKYIKRYEWFRALCALLSAMIYPCYTYMVLQFPGLYFVALLLDVAAFFDTVQRMLVGYYNQNGLLIYHPFSTAAHYIKGAFVVDLFGWLPLEHLQSPLKETFKQYYRLTQARQVLMMNRLLQLYRLPGAMYTLSEYIERRDILIVLKAIPLFMALLNTLTCFMVFYSVDIYGSSTTENTWLIVPLKDEGGSWVNLFNDTFRFNMTATPWNLHLATYFWVVYETTTTGYNCFGPSNFRLMETLFVGMVIGAMITTYFSVRIISIRANVNRELAEYQEAMKDIAVFMRRENLPSVLQKEVMEYYEYNWEKMGGVDYANVLKLCDQITLRTDTTLHLYGPTFAQCPFLSHCDTSLLRAVGRAVHNMYFLRDMILIQKDDVLASMYFVDYGHVHVTEGHDDRSGRQLHRGSVFGNLSSLPTMRSPVSVVATARVHLLQVNTVVFHTIVTDFPQVAQLLQGHRPNNESYIEGIKSTTHKGHVDGIAITRGLLRHLHFKDKLFQIYLILVSMACIYADLYNAGFQDNSKLLITVLYVLDLGFFVKVVTQLCLPIMANSTHVKEMLTAARTTYLKSTFKYDLMSCLPIELFSFLGGDKKWFYFSLLRLNRIFRLVTVYKCLERHNSRITINLTLSTVFTVLVWFTLFVHSVTCMWYFISYIEENQHTKSSWVYKDNGESWCNGSMYVCSVYFILTTFTQNGVGDIMPKTHTEVLFVSILQIISTLVYMIYVGEFSNIIQFQSFRSVSFYCKYLELQEFLRNNRVSKNLVNIVNRYSLHLWRESRGLQMPHFLTHAPNCLRLQIMSAAYMHLLTKNPVFEECEPAFLRQLVGWLQLYTYNADMFVVKEHEITDSMYFIHTGQVMETNANAGDGRTYLPEECFGVENGLIADTPYAYSYRTLMKCQVLTLRLTDWEHLLDHFPRSRDSIDKHFMRDDSDSSKNLNVMHYWNKPDKWSRSKPLLQTRRNSTFRRPSLGGTFATRPRRPAARERITDSSAPPPTRPTPPGNYGFFPINKSPDPHSSPEALSHIESAVTDTAAATTQPANLAMELAPQTSDAEESDVASVDLSTVKYTLDAVKHSFSNLASRFASTASTKSKLNEPPAHVPDEPGSIPVSSKEPIVTQPFSSHSLKITELPSSSTKIASTTITPESMVEHGQRENLQTSYEPEAAPSKKASQQQLPEMINLTERRPSVEMVTTPDKLNDDQIEWDDRSIQSQLSLVPRASRGPRDVDEALKSSLSLIGKLENKLFHQKETSEIQFQKEAPSDKDLLLLEQDEAITTELLQKIRKSQIDKANAAIPDNVVAEVAEARTSDSKNEIRNVRIHESLNEETALVPYDPSVAESTQFKPTEEEPTSTSRLKRSVRYDMAPRERADDQTSLFSIKSETQSLRSTQSARSENQSARSLRFDTLPPNQRALRIAKAKKQKYRDENQKDKDEKEKKKNKDETEKDKNKDNKDDKKQQ